MKTIGYARVSTVLQQLDSQLNALKQYGCARIHTEFDSGRNIQRKELSNALNALEPGDTFVTLKLDRLSRGTKHLLGLMEDFNKKTLTSSEFKIILIQVHKWENFSLQSRVSLLR